MNFRLPTALMAAFIILSLSGCKDAKKFVDESKEGYRVVEEFSHQLMDLSRSLKTNDFAKAKEVAIKADQLLSTRAVSWSVQILITEEAQGVGAAKASIERLKGAEGVTQSELAALGELEKYFNQKGDASTGDLIVMIGAIVAEAKYGHGAGGLLLRTRQTYRAVDVRTNSSRTNLPAN